MAKVLVAVLPANDPWLNSPLSSCRLHLLCFFMPGGGDPKVCRILYVGFDWISKTIRYVFECTHFDKDALGLVREPSFLQ